MVYTKKGKESDTDGETEMRKSEKKESTNVALEEQRQKGNKTKGDKQV